MGKHKIIETQEAIDLIVNKLSNSEINLYLTDRSELNILIDDNAKCLLISYYESKLLKR